MFSPRATVVIGAALVGSALLTTRLDGEETELDQSLKSAAGYGNTEEVEALLAEGANPNATDEYGKTALFRAVRGENLEVLKLLIEAGGDVNATTKDGDSLLSWATRDPAKVRMLLEAGAKPDDRAMNSAASVETAKLLLAAGGRPDAGLKPAAQAGDVPLIQLFLEKGADVNQDDEGYTALHVAALQGGPDAVALLLKHKADPNAVDKQQQTPLHHAVSGDGDPGVVKLLLDAGAKLNVADEEGLTPVRMAGMRGPTPVYKMLLAASGGKEPEPAPAESPHAAKSTAELLKSLADSNRGQRMAVQRELARRGPAIMPEIQQAVAAGAPVEQFFELFTALGPAAKEAIPLIEKVLGEKEQVLGAAITLQRIDPGALASLSDASQRQAAEALYEIVVDPKSDVYGGFAGNMLASMGKPATPAILRLLRHESPGYRAGMARMLARVKGSDPQIKAELERLTGDDNASVRTRAAEALKTFSGPAANDDASRKARAALVAIITRPMPEYVPAAGGQANIAQLEQQSVWRNEALDAARSLARYGPEAIDDLLPVLTPMQNPNRSAAVAALTSMGPDAMPRFLELLGHEDDAIAMAALQGLTAISQYESGPSRARGPRPASPEELAASPSPVTQALLPLMEGDDQRLRIRAVKTLRGVGPRASAAAPKLRQLAGDKTEQDEVRIAAAHAMLNIDHAGAPSSPEVLSCLPLLADRLNRGSIQEQILAAKILKEYGPAAKETLPKLRARLDQPTAAQDLKDYGGRDPVKQMIREAIEIIEGRRDRQGNRIR